LELKDAKIEIQQLKQYYHDNKQFKKHIEQLQSQLYEKEQEMKKFDLWLEEKEDKIINLKIDVNYLKIMHEFFDFLSKHDKKFETKNLNNFLINIKKNNVYNLNITKNIKEIIKKTNDDYSKISLQYIDKYEEKIKKYLNKLWIDSSKQISPEQQSSWQKKLISTEKKSEEKQIKTIKSTKQQQSDDQENFMTPLSKKSKQNVWIQVSDFAQKIQLQTPTKEILIKKVNLLQNELSSMKKQN